MNICELLFILACGFIATFAVDVVVQERTTGNDKP
jgi:hypothetical protein